MPTGKDDLISAIREAITSTLDERNRVDAQTHKTHHDYVADLIECSKRRREIFDGVVKYIAGIGALAAVSYIGAAVIKALTTNWHP